MYKQSAKLVIRPFYVPLSTTLRCPRSKTNSFTFRLKKGVPVENFGNSSLLTCDVRYTEVRL